MRRCYRGSAHLVVVPAALAALSLSAVSEAAGPSRTPAHVYLTAKAGRYTALITATRQGRTANLVVYLSRGGGADQQTHNYVFTLAPGTVTVDTALGTAHVHAALGSFGSINLTVHGNGKTTTQAACTGPGTLTRPASVTGKISLRLGALGTIRSVTRHARLDRLTRAGTPGCASPPCRRFVGTEIAGITLGSAYLSVQADGLGHSYVFATVSQQVARPKVSITHTRLASGGSVSPSPGATASDRSVSVTGGGPAGGSLTFAGTGVVKADAGCRGHTVLSMSAPINGHLEMPVDGAGVVSVNGDGSATAPVAAYREQLS